MDTVEQETEQLDEAIVLVAGGDRRAFDRVYAMTAPRVRALVLRVLRDPAQAEEVVQEVFLEVWLSASRFDRARGRAAAWLTTVAHRRAVDRVRASQASRDRDLRQGVRELEVAHDTVTENAELRLEFDRVRTALDALPVRQREALELGYLGGLGHAEVAAHLDVPLSTAKSRAREGLLRLRAALV